FEPLQGALTIGSQSHLVTFAAQHLTQRFANAGIVIHHQHLHTRERSASVNDSPANGKLPVRRPHGSRQEFRDSCRFSSFHPCTVFNFALSATQISRTSSLCSQSSNDSGIEWPA